MNESQIFNAALRLATRAERAAFLAERCSDNAQLRSEVEGLLKLHDNDPSFLEKPVPAVALTVEQCASERPGAMIGPYKLLEQIGEGGMGLVFMAEQQQPVRRLVALKLVKPGMDTKQVIARFEAEQQALAVMDHPNIAKVHDAGTTETGRPFFVMELVRGIPINEFCDQQKLTVRQRLELFIQVCQAVQHAHQKGIIHRDLKPTNVLVTMDDVQPIPKVIDFGIAKALGQLLTDQTLHTGFSQLVGTPLYMSPEQARMNQLGVDTRSDVYSLGVLLYELLTGTTPFDKERMKSVGFDEMRRMIREDEPPRPSTRMSTLNAQALSTVSQQRGIDPRSFTATLRGELDWIVMKTLEKDRSRRYESASAMAADIQRYLSDEPVLACPPTTMYRFQKFARKHKPAIATAAAIALCLLLGTTVSAWQAARATQAEAQANANEQKAVASEQKAVANEQKAVANAVAAEQKEQDAVKQRDEVKALNQKLAAKEQQLQRSLYASNMNLAKHAWDGGVIARVQELLDQHHPQPGEADLRGFEWHYVHRLCHRELLTLPKGDFGKMEAGSVVFSPNGKRIASGCHGIKVWDAQTGQEVLSIKTGVDWNVVFSPDGQRLASVSNQWDSTQNRFVSHEVKIWDAQTGQEIFSFPVPGIAGTGRTLWWVAYSPDGKHLATSSGEWVDPPKPGEINIWDAQTGQEIQTLKGQDGAILRFAYSPDGTRLASVGADTVKVWDTQTGEALLTLGAMDYDVAFSLDGTRLAGTSWDRATGSAFKVWDAKSGQELLTLGTAVMSVAFSPDGKRLAGGKRNGEVRVLDAQTGEEILSLKGHMDQVSGLAFSPDGTRLASNSRDGTVKVWDAAGTPEARTVSGSADKISSVTYSPDGKRLAGIVRDRATASATATGIGVKVWDAASGQELLTLKEHTGRAVRVVYSPDGKRLASGGGTWDDKLARFVAGEVKVWDAQTGRELVTFLGHTSAVVSIAFSPDGKRVASSGSRPGGKVPTDPLDEVKVWDVETAREIFSLKGHKKFVDSVAYSPDGKRLATLSRDNTVKVWDAQTGHELLSLKVQTFLTGSVAFSPDSQRLASSNNATVSGSGHSLGGIKVWDAQTGQELLSLKSGGIGEISAVVFSPNGNRLVAGSGNPRGGGGPIKVWDAETGQELLTLNGVGYHDGISFSPDGHMLASDVHGKVTIYDATPLPESRDR